MAWLLFCHIVDKEPTGTHHPFKLKRKQGLVAAVNVYFADFATPRNLRFLFDVFLYLGI
jgi:hypothetical protein